jgi:hypothetical protein
MRKILLNVCASAFIVLLASMSAFSQGVTSSSMLGTVYDESGEPLPGANIIAKHTPTGTTYGAATDISGRFRLPNMKVGGPYVIDVSFVGYKDQKLESVYLSLGEPFEWDFSFSAASVEQLSEVTVKGTRTSSGENAGAATQISQEAIDNMPTLNRDLNDFTRLTPQAKQTGGGGFSIAGINNRYNAIYFDGAVNNDVFGLSSNGTNGGQTGASPISVDAIEQIQVVISPYDVSYGGFAGGGINAVTKSGTNNLEGGLYFFTQNESLAGKTNKTLTDRSGGERESLDEFTTNFVGLNIGGPIIKDKLFLFVNAEKQNEETPLPFEQGDYAGNTSIADLANLGTYLQDQYGYDAGDFGSKVNALEATRLFAKLNWNINDKHQLMVRHNYTNILQTNVFGSGTRSINYGNNGINFPSVTNSTAVELTSRFNNKMSNNLIIGYTTVNDDRDPIGADFPSVSINDGNGAEISFGSEAFSTANALKQTVLTITDNFNYYAGDHTLTFGTHNEFMGFYNLFIRQNFGFYDYDNIDDFLNNDAPGFYTRSYSLVDDVTGDGSAAAAEFNAMQLGFYVQDEYKASNKLTLTGGLRLDIPIITSDPKIDANFNATTLVAIADAGYDLQGAQGGQSPDGQLMWSPRVGFNYDLFGDKKTIIRGGTGVFTSRVPFVWPGGMFTNNGVTIGGFNNFDVAFPIEFIGDVDQQYTNPNLTIPQGQVDLFTRDFKFPQVFRSSLAIDQSFDNGWFVSLEGILTKTLNNVQYTSVNSDPTVDFNWTNGANNTDDRPVYTRDNIDPTYSAVYLASNTNKGYTYTVTGQVQKSFDFGLFVNAAYTYGDAYAIFEGTSSQNSSQWRGAFSTDGRNNAVLGRSDFSPGSRVISSINYGKDWSGDGLFTTTVSLFYSGESGSPYSYVYGFGAENGSDPRNINSERGSTSRTRSLIYVPASQNDIALIDITDGPTAAQQWTALNKFIEEDDYLSTRRGQYAEQNGGRAPFINQIDFKLAQDIGMKIGDKVHKLQFTLDVFNFANLLNSSWGAIYSNPFDYNLINFEGYQADGTTPQFSFDEDRLGLERFNISNRASRWRARVGIRYTFR